MTDAAPEHARQVVIVGGGAAALEAVLALRHLAPEVSIELVAPHTGISVELDATAVKAPGSGAGDGAG